MELLEFKKKLIDALANNNVALEVTDDKAEKLYALTNIMLEVNKSMNLTAITDEDAIIVKHYADSLMVASYIPRSATVIDVGCGAGFPCLPLAIFREDLRITALDSTAKRIRYIDDTAKKLGITNVTPIAARAEELGKQNGYRECFDVATARAVAALPVLSELCLPFVKVGGKFVSMKASQGSQEAIDAKNAIKLCGGADSLIIRADLTENGEECESRRLIITKKVENTPKIYPRAFAKISKKPL
jgi:16S rRNA (guanine527-N7)-methyltransferase